MRRAAPLLVAVAPTESDPRSDAGPLAMVDMSQRQSTSDSLAEIDRVGVRVMIYGGMKAAQQMYFVV